MTCSECGRPARSKGLCNRHYLRMWKYGSLDLPQSLTGRDLLFASMMVVGDCWLFIGSVSDRGYGRIQGQYAHRLAYETFVGPIPDDLHIDHVKARGCTSRLCINPAHLEPVTQAVNNARVTLTACRNGHEWTEENIYVSPDGRRFCRTCQRLRRARHGSVSRVQIGRPLEVR